MRVSLLSTPLLPLLASAAPTPADNNTPPSFRVMAIRSASPIHYAQLNAAGQKFWLGGETATYCPTQVGEACPPGTQTVFFPGGSALNVMVPGGQRVYVAPDGALSFTQAHSANIPPGSSLGPFAYVPGEPWAHYTYTGWGASGFMACPTVDGTKWQVFAALRNATVPTGNVADCLGFSALAVPWEEGNQTLAAWQYI